MSSSDSNATPVILGRGGDNPEHDSAVHLFPLPLADHSQGGAAMALCGACLRPELITTVEPGQGGKDWCAMCFTAHVTGNSAPSASAESSFATPTVAGRAEAVRAYRALGWPVTTIREEIRLDLDDAVALRVPVLLAAEITDLLIRRRCAPAVLAHPAAPAHRTILAGDRYVIPLPWPNGIERITTHVVLPPTTTTHGPVFWVRPPHRLALRLCREIDVLAALRNLLVPAGPRHLPRADT